MERTVVIYKSKYGTTQKYAHWIAEDTHGAVYPLEDVRMEHLKNAETIVYCGGLYAGGLLGFNFIKRNYGKLKGKKLIVVAVGATTKKQDAVEELKARNLTGDMKNEVQFFLLRGGLNYKKMNVLDRFLMYMLVKSVKRKKPEQRNDEENGFLATYGKIADFTSRKAIQPILESIRA